MPQLLQQEEINTTHTACPVCGMMRTPQEKFRLNAFQIGSCPDCSLVYLTNPPTREELQAFYSLGYFEGDLNKRGYQSYGEDRAILEKNFSIQLRQMLDAIARTGGPARGRLLEVGCAYGYFLNLARNHFDSVQGVEFSAEAAEHARQALGLDVRTGDLLDAALEPESFEVAALWDVIEHLTDPRAVVREIGRLLKPGGHVFLTTGNVESLYSRLAGSRWRLINPPQHISYFSPGTLRRLFESEGFEVISTRSAGKHVSLGFIAFILSYLFGARWIDAFKANRIGRRIIQFSIYINLFDVTLLHARKRG